MSTATQPFRIAERGRIDPMRSYWFQFDQQPLLGHPGDTLASALLANGVHLVGRGFKYHRPRGILTAGSEEPNALVQLEGGAHTEPNTRATVVELYDGLTAMPQNAWPRLEFDIGAINDAMSAMFPAGFYYKTFMGPAWGRTAAARNWLLFEGIIRRAAGLGKSPVEPDPDHYDRYHAHADVVVIGGGAAGLMAALTAGRSGARTVLIDEGPMLGGGLLNNRPDTVFEHTSVDDWLAESLAELHALSTVTVLSRTTAFGYGDDNMILLAQTLAGPGAPSVAREGPRQRYWRLRAGQVVLAAGALGRHLAFTGNDRPGVMMATAARRYLHHYGVAPGETVVVFGGDDEGYRAAVDLADAGVTVAAIVDPRPTDQARGWDAKARAAGITVMHESVVTGTRGRLRLKAVCIQALDGAERVKPNFTRVDCDSLLMAGGWTPAVHLFSQSRGKLSFDPVQQRFVPGTTQQALRVAGAITGEDDLAQTFAAGVAAGAAAAGDMGFSAAAVAVPTLQAATPERSTYIMWDVPAGAPSKRGKAFVDYQNDVTVKDLKLALREGFRSVEHLKRYTTTGMATDQGKLSNMHAIGIAAKVQGIEMPAVGTTTYRMPYTPVTFGAIAGRTIGGRIDPTRHTPMHAWHVKQGAAFEPVGQWLRPMAYPRGHETLHAAIQRESVAAREAVGLMDSSTLGKIDVRGPDAGTLLNRLYTNAWKKLGIGKIRYGLMLNDEGMIFDDGVAYRLAEDHYVIATTSGNAAHVMEWIEEWLQTEWPDLKVFTSSITEQWASATLTGVNARTVLQSVCDADISAAMFPHMTVLHARVAGIAARILRVSFTGEVSYEVNVPSNQGAALWDALWEAGQSHGITPYGTEAMHLLRGEKGFIMVGQETDGTTTPYDLGMNWIVNSKKGDFIGKRGMARSYIASEGRKQLVGLFSVDKSAVLDEGAQIVERVPTGDGTPEKMIGHVTSAYYSPNLGYAIAMALVENGRARVGERLYAVGVEKTLAVTIAPSSVFFDAEGARLNG